MPLFYFDLGDDDGGHDPDLDGLEFDNLEAAYIDAYHTATEMWAEARHRGRDLSNECFVIKGATGKVLLELPFSEVLGTGRPIQREGRRGIRRGDRPRRATA